MNKRQQWGFLYEIRLMYKNLKNLSVLFNDEWQQKKFLYKKYFPADIDRIKKNTHRLLRKSTLTHVYNHLKEKSKNKSLTNFSLKRSKRFFSSFMAS